MLQHFVQREENQTKATTVGDKPLSTVGIDISYLVFEGRLDGKQRKVEFRTWDFAGQVGYSGITSLSEIKQQLLLYTGKIKIQCRVATLLNYSEFREAAYILQSHTMGEKPQLYAVFRPFLENIYQSH